MIKERLVLQGQRSELIRQREDDVNIGDIEQIVSLDLQPIGLPFRLALAFLR